MTAFANMDELKARLDWELDEDELRIGASALDDASDLACFYGREWTAETAPRLVKTTVLKACVRYMQNPAGYTVSRAGDETLQWNDDQGENAGTVYFTVAEQKLFAELAGRKPKLGSAPIQAWGTVDRTPATGRVPCDDGSTFPLFADYEEPW